MSYSLSDLMKLLGYAVVGIGVLVSVAWSWPRWGAGDDPHAQMLRVLNDIKYINQTMCLELSTSTEARARCLGRAD